MDPGNLNAFIDCCNLLEKRSSKFQAAMEKIEHCEILFNRQETLLSSTISDLIELVSHEFSFEETELQLMMDAFQGADTMMTKLSNVIQCMKRLARCRLELSTRFSRGNCETFLRKTNDFIESFQTITLSFCEIANRFENLVIEIQESVRTLTAAYNATDSNT
ncbi:hypothetical protein TNIN_361321 [Trichonephila inaurata madagascariensis]|uniref:Uncharacterized protein n=1 Tax=Trichonephila inaurata madagascariensis TaxID=2747483 RepID=A0A8X6Y743_9ARAC|nr:hypothetical protein TNIN_361321 [Trichonephila inaurata madagascariensis]